LVEIAEKNLPHYRLTPTVPRTPGNISIHLILPETGIPGLHCCCSQYGSIVIHFFAVGWAPDMCNVTKCLMADQGQFRVFESLWFWYRRKHVCDFLL